MASVHPRKNKHGEIINHQVKWRLGGGRGGDPQNERLDDEVSAEVFKNAVDEHGQQWPPGWATASTRDLPTSSGRSSGCRRRSARRTDRGRCR